MHSVVERLKYLLVWIFIISFIWGIYLVSAEFRDMLSNGNSLTVDGWIPYYERVNKENFYLPKGGDPKKYIKNFDPSSIKHQKIIRSSNKREK